MKHFTQFIQTPVGMLLLVVASLAVLVLIGWVTFRLTRRTFHRWHLKQARKTWKKLQSISGERTQQRRLAYLRKVNPYVFEELVLLGFRQKGLKTVRNRRYSKDGGLDGIVIENGRCIPVQSKRYTGHIKREHVEAFSLLVDRKKVPYGYFVHTGRTGQGSNAFQFPNIRFISGEKLLAHLSDST